MTPLSPEQRHTLRQLVAHGPATLASGSDVWLTSQETPDGRGRYCLRRSKDAIARHRDIFSLCARGLVKFSIVDDVVDEAIHVIPTCQGRRIAAV